MPLTGNDLVHAISQLKQENYFGNIVTAIEFDNNTGDRSSYTFAEMMITDDATKTIVTPTEQEMDDAFIRWQATQVLESNVNNIRSGAKAEVEADAQFKAWTGDDAALWIDSNVTDLESAKTVLKKMARMVIALRNERWPDLEGQ